MSVYATTVTLDLCDQRTLKHFPLDTNVVWVREESEVPEGQEPVEWILLTNHAIEHLEDACLVVYGYSQRWRIEEFHRTWKQGVATSNRHSCTRANTCSAGLPCSQP